MASRDEFTSFLRADQQQQQTNGGGYGTNSPSPDWMQSWANQQQGQGSSPARPPRSSQSPKTGEQAPLLPPMPQAALSPPPPQSQFQIPLTVSEQLKLASRPRRVGGHGRSRSELPTAFGGAPSADPSHPLMMMGGGQPAPLGTSRPPRRAANPLGANVPLNPSFNAGAPLPPGSVISPLMQSPKSILRPNSHRRAKSDIPLKLYGSGGSIGGGRLITKQDLLKNLPNPRWAPAPKPIAHCRNRSRTGSDGLSLSGSMNSSGHGYGATSSIRGESKDNLMSIGSVIVDKPKHVRAMSTDASVKSVTTNLEKSALFKGVTDTGRIQMQLPKDSFRILMDCQLEAGQVYKRKLFDDEDQFFVDFHTTEEDDPEALDGRACHCPCDKCQRCHDRQKRLPPDLYVMAVDTSIYRRMLDEVISSQSMPCGTFFCGECLTISSPFLCHSFCH